VPSTAPSRDPRAVLRRAGALIVPSAPGRRRAPPALRFASRRSHTRPTLPPLGSAAQRRCVRATPAVGSPITVTSHTINNERSSRRSRSCRPGRHAHAKPSRAVGDGGSRERPCRCSQFSVVRLEGQREQKGLSAGIGFLQPRRQRRVDRLLARPIIRYSRARQFAIPQR
jgi:hypothetical protein